MSVITNNLLLGDEGYFLTKSLRLRSSASAYLNRTPASASNRTTWTWSGWVKRGFAGGPNNFVLFFAESGGNTNARLEYLDSGRFRWFYQVSGVDIAFTLSNALYRDYSAWYHVVYVYDSTQTTGANRQILYVNGVQATNSSVITPAQNTVTSINDTVTHWIGRNNTPEYFDGYLTEVNFIDGQALTPSSFGETSAITGAWIPKKYIGTYGANGFYLPFTDNSALTTSSNVGLGKDFSGNNNYWTTNNISITSGETYDSMTDVPTLTSSTAANYCTWNPAFYRSNETISDGGLKCTTGTAGGSIGTIAVSSGKWYWESISAYTGGTTRLIGIVNHSLYANNLYTKSIYYQANGAYSINNGADVSYGSSISSGDIVGIALDVDAQTVIFYKNGVAQGSAISISSVYTLGETVVPAAAQSGGASRTIVNNWGQRPFAYTPPTGFLALNTFNLPTPSIGAAASTQAGKYFNTVLYTGNGSTQSVTGVGFQPDFVWVKVRSSTQNHSFNDAVRSAGYYLVSNATAAERFQGEFDSFDADGFSLTYNAAEGDYNASTKTYVAWNWKANGAGSTNTAGTITSTVSANTTAGFSIVTYTGNGTAGATVGHGLGVAPKMVIVKSRSNSATNWVVYHESAGNNGFLLLNSTNAFSVASTSWNNTSPTSTVFTLGNGTSSNGNGSNQVAYCFADVAGYSAFGSYTGNGNANGAFVYTGFRPRFVMIKTSSNAGYNWNIHDAARNPNNSANLVLYPNTSAGDDVYGAGSGLDILSNGFKIRDAGGGLNGNGFTYIYMAFAENPFKYSLAR